MYNHNKLIFNTILMYGILTCKLLEKLVIYRDKQLKGGKALDPEKGFTESKKFTYWFLYR